MENASKVLIIAGAILISILLISVGILVYNSTKGATSKSISSSDMVSLETQISIIDMQFSKYNGVQNADAIKKMLDEVVEYNRNNGSYSKPDENTTNYKRKISVIIHKEILGTDKRSK